MCLSQIQIPMTVPLNQSILVLVLSPPRFNIRLSRWVRAVDGEEFIDEQDPRMGMSGGEREGSRERDRGSRERERERDRERDYWDREFNRDRSSKERERDLEWERERAREWERERERDWDREFDWDQGKFHFYSLLSFLFVSVFTNTILTVNSCLKIGNCIWKKTCMGPVLSTCSLDSIINK